MSGPTGEVQWLAFSPDGARLYGRIDDHIQLWDVARGTRVAQVPGWTAALSPDGARLCAAAEDSVGRIFDAVTGLLLVELIGHDRGGLRSLEWSRDGTTIVTTGLDGTFRTWNAATGEPYTLIEAATGTGRAANAAGGAAAARISPDGTRFLTIDGTGASLWSVDRGALVRELATGGMVWSAAWSPDETSIATAGLERGGLWPDRGPPSTFLLPFDGTQILYDVNWSPDGTRIVLAGLPAVARVFRRDGTLAVDLAGHTGRVARTAFSPDGRLIATASSDRTARLWNADTGAPVAVLPHGGSVLAAAWSKDGRRLATACFDHHLRVWNVATGALVIDLDGGDRRYLDVTLSPDGRELAAAGMAGTAEIWDLGARTRRLELVGHAFTTTNAVWSPDGALLATASSDHSVRIWDPVDGAVLATFHHGNEVMSLQWSRDGERLLAAAADGAARAWDVRRARGNPLLIDAFIAAHVR